MNPLFILFWISLILEDYFTRNGIFLKIYISLFIIYLIFAFCYLERKKHNNLNLFNEFDKAAFNELTEPTTFINMQFDLTKTKLFLDDYFIKTNKKISYALLFSKVLSQVSNKSKSFNKAIKSGNVKFNILKFPIIIKAFR